MISNPEYSTFVSLLLRRAARGGLPQRAVDELYAHVLRRESLISTTSPGFDARTLDRARQHVEARTADPLDPNTDARLSFDLGSYLINAKDDPQGSASPPQTICTGSGPRPAGNQCSLLCYPTCERYNF